MHYAKKTETKKIMMRVHKLTLTFILFLIFGLSSYAQLDSIVNLLSDSYSKEQYPSIKIPHGSNGNQIMKTGYSQLDSIFMAQYKISPLYYYHLLDSLASDQDLINLTSHESHIVQSYAAFALGYRDTLLLPEVFKKMLDDSVIVRCTYTDVVIYKITASMIFSSLWQRRRETGYPSDNYMDNLYSIYLLHENTPPEDIGLQLSYFRSKSLKSTIETLAFERKNISAIRYMYKWYKGEYYSQLNDVYLEIIDSVDFNIIQYGSIPVIKEIIANLIDLHEKETLRKLGGWLKNNREKWIGLEGIDKILDNSYDIRDSIGWGVNRYPKKKADIEFLLGDWYIISSNTFHHWLNKEIIILEKARKNKRKDQKLKFEYSSGTLYSIYKSIDDKNERILGSCAYDLKNKRICLDTNFWDWYKIKLEDNLLILTKE